MKLVQISFSVENLDSDLGYGDLETKTFNEVAQLQQKFLDEGYGKFFNKATGKMDEICLLVWVNFYVQNRI